MTRKLIALIAALALCLTAVSALAEYRTPTTDYEVWQEYTPEQYGNEDVSEKGIAYQFAASADINRNISVLVNLYDDGFARVTQTVEGNGVSYYYYGYWANLDDEIFFAVTCYSYQGETVEGAVNHGDIATVDYTYDLVSENDVFAFGLNACLGFANGGQYVRSVDIEGSGDVAYETEEAFLEYAVDFWANYAAPEA